MSFFSGKKIFLLGFILILLVAVPLTVFLTQQTQKTTSSAAPATTLSFTPPIKTMNVGDTANFDVMMTPGTNQVSFVKLVITHDPTKLSVDPTSGFTANSIFSVLQGPTDAACPNNSSLNCLTVTLSVGSNPSAVISGPTPTKLGTLIVKAVIPSTASINVDLTQSQALSIASTDQASENVLTSQPAIATVTIGGTTATVSPSPTSSTNKAPVCSSLAIDRSSTGAAPYSLTFTATGTDSDGTISTVTFTFGDGQQTNVTQGGGIGTNSINAQIAHTYNNAGTFTASAILTDNQTATSPNTTCTTTITVTTAVSGSTGGTGTVAPTATITATPTATLTLPPSTITAAPTIPATGPGEKILGIGAAGIIFSIIGGLLFLGL